MPTEFAPGRGWSAVFIVIARILRTYNRHTPPPVRSLTLPLSLPRQPNLQIKSFWLRAQESVKSRRKKSRQRLKMPSLHFLELPSERREKPAGKKKDEKENVKRRRSGN